MKRDLRFERRYAQAPATLWHALTDQAALAAWLMPNDFEPRVGHKFNFRTKPAPGFDGIVHCEVLTCERPHKLSYTWRGGNIATVVSWTLEQMPDGGTRLLLEQTGFVGVRALMVSAMLKKGWEKMLDQRILQAIDGTTPEGCYANG
jgi:uncharacterized protein YndB with AHSA1/START domain